MRIRHLSFWLRSSPLEHHARIDFVNMKKFIWVSERACVGPRVAKFRFAWTRETDFVCWWKEGEQNAALPPPPPSDIFKTERQRKFYANWEKRQAGGVGGVRDSGMGKYSENEEEYPGGQQEREGLIWTGGSGGKTGRGRVAETERLLLEDAFLTQLKSTTGRTEERQRSNRVAKLSPTINSGSHYGLQLLNEQSGILFFYIIAERS